MKKNKEITDKSIKIDKKQVTTILKENGCETLEELQNLVNFLNSENKRLHAINVESLKKINILGVRVKTLENQTKNYDEQFYQSKMIYKNKYKKKINELQNQINTLIHYSKDKENEYNRLIEEQVQYFRNFFLNFNKNVNLIISNDHTNSSSGTNEDSSRISSKESSNNEKDSIEEQQTDTKQDKEENDSSHKGSLSDIPIEEDEYVKKEFVENEEVEYMEDKNTIKKRNSYEVRKNSKEYKILSKVRSDSFRYFKKDTTEKELGSNKLNNSVQMIERKKNKEEPSMIMIVEKKLKNKNLEMSTEDNEEGYIQEIHNNYENNLNANNSNDYQYAHDYDKKYEEVNFNEEIQTDYGYVHDYDKEYEEDNIMKEQNENNREKKNYEDNDIFSYHKKQRETLPNKSVCLVENKKHNYIDEEIKKTEKNQITECSHPVNDNFNSSEQKSENTKELGKSIEGNTLETQKTLNKIIDYNIDIKNRLSNLLEDVYTDPNKKKISLNNFNKNNDIQNDIPKNRDNNANDENTNSISKHLSKTMNPQKNIMEIINNKLDMNCLEDLDTSKPKYVKFNTIHREIMNPRQHFVNSNKKTIDQIICL